VLDIEPNAPYLIVKLAQLYREAGYPEQGVREFRSVTTKISEVERGFCFEWGTTEGSAGRHALGVWLAAFSLADEATRQPPDNKDAKLTLGGLSIAFAELYDRFNAPVFIEACGAAVQLGLTLERDPTAKSWFQRSQDRARAAGVEDVPLRVALERLRVGIIAAWEQRDDELPEWVVPGNALTFSGLARLLRI
jgi:hypothetical protein